MLPSLAGKTVAITGASAGIGRATALHLARQGAQISICARRLDRLQQLAGEIEQLGAHAEPVAADVTSDADMQRFVERTIARFGRLDVMICNAGYGLYGAIDAIEPARMQRVMDVNFFGTYHAARAALRIFRRQSHGHIIVVSSIVGKRGVPYMGAYAATKFAQVGLAESLRAETLGTGIHVSVVCPVSTDTDFFTTMTEASGFKTSAAGPTQPVEEVATAIANAIRKPVPEVFPYWKARALVWLAAVAPGLCDRVVQKWGRKPVV